MRSGNKTISATHLKKKNDRIFTDQAIKNIQLKHLFMHLTLQQFSTIWMDPEANLEIVRQAAGSLSHKEGSLLILPEMFNTGYTMTPSSIPAEWVDLTINALQTISSDTGTGICGSIPFLKNGKWYNTFILVDGNGAKIVYDKIHLFTPAGEKASYEAGTSSETLDYRGWKILPLICYDLRFPYLSFREQLPDVIIYTANWPAARIDHWDALLTARAIENQCYVAGVNRTGQDENGFIYPGHSMLIDFSGKKMLCMDDKPGFSDQEIGRLEMESYRKKLPFFDDRKL